MQRVTIWDLDYYYARVKRNCFNIDAMRISSYHKQLGDQINFVEKEDDIRRPYDIYYVIKEKQSTPNPPMDFYTNSKVRWWGEANRARLNWKMDRVMMGCRPDYLLYPEKNTDLERSEYLRLFDNAAKLLPITQDARNTYKRKHTYVSDKYMWESSKNSLLQALEILKGYKNISFLEPIRIDILLSDEDIKSKFFELNITHASRFEWAAIDASMVEEAIDFLQDVQVNWPTALIGKLNINCDADKHWVDYLAALKDFENIKHAIIRGRKLGLMVALKPLASRLDTPYFYLYEEISKWSNKKEPISWFEYLKRQFPYCSMSNPKTWSETYRDLIRQTWEDQDFLLTKWKTQRISENEIPWELLKQEFKYGI